MRTALRMTKPIIIKTNDRAKLLVNGDKEVALADIIAVRYAFGNEQGSCGFFDYNAETNTIAYNQNAQVIAENRKTLNKSLHIIELDMGEGDTKMTIEGLRQICGNVAIFAYINFNGYTPEFEAQLARVIPAFADMDRLMIRERTTETLSYKDAQDLMKYVKEKVGDPKTNKVGLCDSPVGCGLGLSCLSAVLCRELAAKYGDSIDMVVPSQNHEGMSGNGDRACNCVGYIEVESIEVLPPKQVGKKAGEPSVKKDGEAETKKKPSLGKKVVVKW